MKRFYMKKKMRNLMLLCFILLMNIGVFGYLSYINRELEIDSILLKEYDNEKNSYTVEIKTKKHFLDFLENKPNCVATLEEEIVTSPLNKNKCLLTLPVNKNFQITIKSNNKESAIYNLDDYINNILDFSFEYSTIYLLVGEESNIEFSDVLINPDDVDYQFTSTDSSVVTVENGILKGIKPGSSFITSSLVEESLEVVVTDLLNFPTYQKQYKPHLPCNYYSEEQANLLDEILAYRITKAGYQTRAAAIEAARFLTLSFPYRIPYFYENGRVHESGINYADGEGRYYKHGLYLHESKFNDIKASFNGPAIWGCPLTNWETDPQFGYYPGMKKPNGLDCSGFVSWVLKNAGFDPGDIGAGETEYPHQLTDLGEYTPLTVSLIDDGTVKVGDLVNYWGHIGIIVGIAGENIYVAESLQNFGGVITRLYSKYTISQTFNHVVLMDDYYKNDGNYTIMW